MPPQNAFGGKNTYKEEDEFVFQAICDPRDEAQSMVDRSSFYLVGMRVDLDTNASSLPSALGVNKKNTCINGMT
jgi:hypothetical protein